MKWLNLYDFCLEVTINCVEGSIKTILNYALGSISGLEFALHVNHYDFCLSRTDTTELMPSFVLIYVQPRLWLSSY
jgi:hypothetical protein